jgi:putative flippase GtrA
MLTKRDYLLVAIIGFCFGVFSVPIINNIKSGGNLGLTTIFGIVVFFTIAAIVALYVVSIVSKKIPIILQLAKFAAVGAFNTFLDWGVLNVLISLTAVVSGLGYALFKGTSFIIANIASYYWNRNWTFGMREKASNKEFGKFFAVSLIGLVINIGIASLVVNFINPIGGLSLKVWANVGAATATLASLVWNFVGYKFFVFVSGKKESDSNLPE